MKRPAAHHTHASLAKRRAENPVLPSVARSRGIATEQAGSELGPTAVGIATEHATPACADSMDVAEALCATLCVSVSVCACVHLSDQASRA